MNPAETLHPRGRLVSFLFPQEAGLCRHGSAGPVDFGMIFLSEHHWCTIHLRRGVSPKHWWLWQLCLMLASEGGLSPSAIPPALHFEASNLLSYPATTSSTTSCVCSHILCSAPTTALSINLRCWVTSGGQLVLQLHTSCLGVISLPVLLLCKVSDDEQEKIHHVATAGS